MGLITLLQFRDALGVSGSFVMRMRTDPPSVPAKKNYNQDEVIATYKRLIRSLPRANQYLLLYVLDLLSVFARKSDKNLMTAKSRSTHSPPPLPLTSSPR